MDLDFCYELFKKSNTSDENLKKLIETSCYDEELFKLADLKRKEIYGTDVFLRGLIEITNFCKNNCFYCGIRQQNDKIKRYRLTEKEILDCCLRAAKLGIKTFVLQGGEDDFFDDDRLSSLIIKIKKNFKDFAITLSLGEKTKESYEKLFKAGAERYLLRHETADEKHYESLHPKKMSLANRKNCLFNLKNLGFKVGSGFLVGSPFQKTEHLIKDLRFLQLLKPEMIGIGPFICHKETPFKDKKNGSINLTLKLIAILRLMFPKALIPATTALLSIKKNTLQKALKAGANVIMPNMSLKKYQNLYKLYDTKKERKEKTIKKLKKNIYLAGYRFKVSRGDPKI